VGNVRQILIRPDSDVDAAWFYALLQLINDMKIGRLIGNEVVGIEVPLGLGPFMNVLAELFGGYLNVRSRTRLFASPR
jgi:hypothetical protein